MARHISSGGVGFALEVVDHRDGEFDDAVDFWQQGLLSPESLEHGLVVSVVFDHFQIARDLVD